MKKQSKKMFNVALATTLAASAVVAVAPSQADAAKSFSDVSDKNSHKANILALAERGIIHGYKDGTFKPGNSVTRGQAAKIIAGILDLDTKNVKNPRFKDVTTKNSNYGAIAALANAGIINGYKSDNTFRPGKTLTRGQMAKILVRGFELKAKEAKIPFKDINKTSFKKEIEILFSNEVTVGLTANTYGVNNRVTRGQLATFVIRAEKAKKATEGETILETILSKVVTEATEGSKQTYATFAFDPTNTSELNGKLNVTVTDNVAISEVRTALKGEQDKNNYSLTSLISTLAGTLAEEGKLDKTYATVKGIKDVVITSKEGDATAQAGTVSGTEISHFIDLENLDVERGNVVKAIDKFVDDSVKLIPDLNGPAKLNDIADLDSIILEIKDESGNVFKYGVTINKTK